MRRHDDQVDLACLHVRQQFGHDLSFEKACGQRHARPRRDALAEPLERRAHAILHLGIESRVDHRDTATQDDRLVHMRKVDLSSRMPGHAQRNGDGAFADWGAVERDEDRSVHASLRVEAAFGIVMHGAAAL